MKELDIFDGVIMNIKRYISSHFEGQVLKNGRFIKALLGPPSELTPLLNPMKRLIRYGFLEIFSGLLISNMLMAAL